MTFYDEFNSFTSSADGSTGWMTTYPYGGAAAYTLAANHEAQFYGSPATGQNPFSDANGVLTISATPSNGDNSLGLPYDSGLITTDKSFSQTYGYFEVRAELPQGQGLWPAFWLLPASNVYTSELDVFEQLGNDPTKIYSTVHGTTNGVWGANSQAYTVANTATGFPTDGVDWEVNTTTYYLDGVETGSAPTPTSMNSPMFMLLNLAVGGAGSWPGAPSAATIFPANMQIDYVHAYATAGTTFVGGPSSIATGTPTMPVVLPTETLLLGISEDSYLGDAQYQVSVDGVATGGILTASASHALGQSKTVSITGAWGTGPHVVSVNFLNDLYGGSLSADRNLYVDALSLGGVSATNAPQALLGNGAVAFAVAAQAATATTTVTAASPPATSPPATSPPATSPPATTQTNPQTLQLMVSEDAYLGDAQYQVAVDGVLQGGIRTTTASHAAGQSDTVQITGNWATGAHSVAVTFLNDLYGGWNVGDRNLYVDGLSVGGVSATNAPQPLMGNGTVLFAVPVAAPVAAPVVAPIVAPIVPPLATPSTGTLVLAVSEDAWQGDAQYQVTVDGIAAGGVRTATASHQAGQSQTVSISGNWGAGPHTVGVNFLNDAYGGSASADRNLYVDQLSLGSGVAIGAPQALLGSGNVSFLVPASLVPAMVVTPPVAGDLVLNLSEDAYLGDAQFSVAIDGKQIGGVQSVTALHANGSFEAFGFTGALSVGTHDVAVTFLNDLYGGWNTGDRNLYVNGATAGGVAVAGASSALMSNGTNHFTAAFAG